MTAARSGGPPLRGAERWVRWLIRLYPAAFRREFGGEMAVVYLEEAGGQRATGWLGTVWFWARTSAVTGWCALAEHIATLHDRVALASGSERQAARRRRFAIVRRQFASDVRTALQSVERRPWSSAAVAGLAAGIAAFAVAAVGVARAGLWRPAYPAQHRLVRIETAFLDMDYESFPVSPFEFVAVQSQVQSYEAFGAWAVRMRNVTIDGWPTRERLVYATAGAFETLGLLAPELPSEEDPRPVYATVPFWRSRLSGDPGAVGRTFEIDGTPVRLAGILPADFRFWVGDISLWAPIVVSASPEREASHILGVVGRLGRGHTLDDARRELQAISDGWGAAYPGRHRPDKSHPLRVRPLGDSLIGTNGPPFRLLGWSAAGLLLLALLHLAGLSTGSMVPASEAIRRGLLATAGSTVGASAAFVGLVAWSATGLGTSAGQGDLGAREALLVVGLILAGAIALTTIMVRASRGPRWGGVLVVLDVAAAIGLLFGAGMLARSLSHLRNQDLGFRPSGLVAFEAAVPAALGDSAMTDAMAARITSFASSLPSVTAVALTSALPMSPEQLPSDVAARSVVATADARPLRDRAYIHYVSAGYTEVVGMRLVRGRRIRGGAEAIVSETLARRLWPDGGGIGARIRPFEYEGAPFATVVGIVQDVVQTTPIQGDAAQLYFAHAAVPAAFRPSVRNVSVVLRSADPDRTARHIPPGLTLDGYTVPISRPTRPLERIEAAARDLTVMLRLVALGAALCLLLGLTTAWILVDPRGHGDRELAIRLAAGLGAGLALAVWVRHALDPLLVGTGLGDIRVVVGVSLGVLGWVTVARRLRRRLTV